MATRKAPQKKKQVKRGGGKKTPPTSHKKFYLKNTNPEEMKDIVVRTDISDNHVNIGDLPPHMGKNIEIHKDGTVSVDVGKEQMDKIMNPPVELKKASDITEVDNLKFEMGRLRTHLVTWNAYAEYEGNLYLIQVDPLNKMVKFLGKGDGPDEAGQKIVQEFKSQ